MQRREEESAEERGAEQSSAGQSSAGQSRAEQRRAEQSGAEQSRVEQREKGRRPERRIGDERSPLYRIASSCVSAFAPDNSPSCGRRLFHGWTMADQRLPTNAMRDLEELLVGLSVSGQIAMQRITAKATTPVAKYVQNVRPPIMGAASSLGYFGR